MTLPSVFVYRGISRQQFNSDIVRHLLGNAVSRPMMCLDRLYKCHMYHLCTALQAVPLGMPSADWQECRPAAFEWSEGSGRVFAAGGTQPRHIYVWDAKRESCAQEVGFSTQPGRKSG
jgi:hypothetical protein